LLGRRIPYVVALKYKHSACAALLNLSVAEPLVWPTPWKFISQLNPEAKLLLEKALMEANRARDKNILSEAATLVSSSTDQEDSTEDNISCFSSQIYIDWLELDRIKTHIRLRSCISFLFSSNAKQLSLQLIGCLCFVPICRLVNLRLVAYALINCVPLRFKTVGIKCVPSIHSSTVLSQ